jgi:hypothetical protein
MLLSIAFYLILLNDLNVLIKPSLAVTGKTFPIADFIFWLLTIYDSVGLCGLSVVRGNQSIFFNLVKDFTNPLGTVQIFGFVYCDLAKFEITLCSECASSNTKFQPPD